MSAEQGQRSPPRLGRKAWRAGRCVLRYSRGHRRSLAVGALAALLVVAARLLMPWPLRALADEWVAGSASRSQWLLDLVPAGADTALVMGCAFFGLIALLGLGDFLERLFFARFAIGTVRDMRADAFAALGQLRGDADARKSGDLVARLISDAQRLKHGLQGFLVHVATNSVVFAGVAVVLVLLDPALGLIFAAAGLATAAVTSVAAGMMFRRTLRFRRKEGKLAGRIHEALQDETADLDFVKLNKTSGRYEASLTRVQGIATWIAHGIYGAAVLLALWSGAGAVRGGRLEAGDLVLFMMYALLMRGPTVRLARQGSRTGRILGAAHRIAKLLRMQRKRARTGERAFAAELEPTPRTTTE